MLVLITANVVVVTDVAAIKIEFIYDMFVIYNITMNKSSRKSQLCKEKSKELLESQLSILRIDNSLCTTVLDRAWVLRKKRIKECSETSSYDL